MQSFLVVSSLFAIAIAAPQGYNYNSPQYSVGSSSQYSVGSIGGTQGSIGGTYSTGFSSFNPAPALPSASSVAAIHRSRPHQRRVLPAIVSKHVFYHSAPEEPDDDVYEDNSTEQQRKHYNVVFIKAPHQSVNKIASQTAQALNEERTAIYVLSKKNDVSEIRQALSDVPHTPVKPEVFFIKYKTAEEAQHAQQTIQSQYDALGGSTNISDEGYAPISSVVGILEGGHGGHGGFGVSGGNGGFTGGHGGFTGGHGGFTGHVSGGDGGIVSSGGGDSFISSGSVSGTYLPANKA